MSVKLYKASSFKYTPFEDFEDGDLDYLNKNGLQIVNNIKEADVVISQNIKHLKRHFWRGLFGKRFLIWTLESRFDTHFNSEIKVFFKCVKCHIMNVYTKDVFVSNLTFHCGVINKKLQLLPNTFKLSNRKAVALMSYYKGVDADALIHNNKNIDLIALRSEIALKGSELNALDVFGKGWPGNVSKEDSREGDWVGRKKKLLDNYHFNLCFENTAAFNYMTEKIWDSIENYCLPIYFGAYTNAYTLFPKNSFIDYSMFNSPEELFQFIKKMTDEEFIVRMNKCINVYNEISEKGIDLVRVERKKTLNKIVDKIEYINNKS